MTENAYGKRSNNNNNNNNNNLTLYTGDMKRADMRSSMTILVLGDEGVGKSSLISTFVSRHFSDDVPGIMTRVRLPPDPASVSSCITTIVDSQGGDSALLQAIASKRQTNLQQQHVFGETGADVYLPSSETVTSKQTFGSSSPYPSDIRIGELQQTKSDIHNNTTATIENVDSIVLVYDFDRIETFSRLENHWLPLIEQCYNGKIPVIVAENKTDLFRSSSGALAGVAAATAPAGGYSAPTADEQAFARKRQQIVSLMQRFPFIRQCIKCSAKNLLRVDDLFIEAQQAVLYPFTPPLYNLETGTLSAECERALTRIFRIYDKDYDNLLSDSELDRFQRETYYVAVFDRDLTAWKKVVSRNYTNATSSGVTDIGGVCVAGIPNAVEPPLRDGKFTVAGFHAIFDVFISQNRLDVVWQALRKHGYDDDLNLYIPKSIISPNFAIDANDPNTTAGASDGLMQNWRLSSAAKKFLANVFRQFDSDGDGMLTQDDVISLFSVLQPPSLPPWHPVRASDLFDRCFSRPKQSLQVHDHISSAGSVGSDVSSPSLDPDSKGNADSTLIVPEASLSSPPSMSHSLLSHTGFSILSASDSLPSIDVGGVCPLSKSLSFLEWMGHWHAIAAISPSVTRTELYRLGHIEDYNATKSKKSKDRRRKKSYIMAASHLSSSYEQDLPSTIPTSTKRPNDDSRLKSREVRVLVLGSASSGKTALLNVLCGALDKRDNYFASTNSTNSPITVRAMETKPTRYSETSATFVKIKRKLSAVYSGNLGNPSKSTKSSVLTEGEEVVIHLIFTDIPESVANENGPELAELLSSKTTTGSKGSVAMSSPASSNDKTSVFDIVMFVFDCTNDSSFDYVKRLESAWLSDETPRLFVGTKADSIGESSSISQDVATEEKCIHAVVEKAKSHCQEFDLEPPLITTAADLVTPGPFLGPNERGALLEHISRCALTNENGISSLRSRPHEEQKRRESARRRTIMWFGGIAAVAVAVGVGLLWGSSSSGTKSKDQKSGGFSWLRSWFDVGPFSRGSSSSQAAVTDGRH